MHKNKSRNNTVVSAAVTSPRSVRRGAVEALASELRKQGYADLADSVTLGPVAVAVEERPALEAEETDLEDEIEDVLDDASDSDDGEFEDDEDEDEFEEELDTNDIAETDEDEADGECDADDDEPEQETKSNPISAVILDPERKYSSTELSTLRAIANKCLTKKHMIPNAKALLASLDEYEAR